MAYILHCSNKVKLSVAFQTKVIIAIDNLFSTHHSDRYSENKTNPVKSTSDIKKYRALVRRRLRLKIRGPYHKNKTHIGESAT